MSLNVVLKTLPWDELGGGNHRQVGSKTVSPGAEEMDSVSNVTDIQI